MNRITPEMVKEAYEKTGLKPIQDHWYGLEDRCGCGLTALAMAKHKELVNEIDYKKYYDFDEFIDAHIHNLLNLDTTYINGFVSGFDGSSNFLEVIDAFANGFEDGQAAWEAVKHLAI